MLKYIVLLIRKCPVKCYKSEDKNKYFLGKDLILKKNNETKKSLRNLVDHNESGPS
jgi:hypothetical protein